MDSAATERTIKQAVERFLASRGTIQPDGTYQGDVERNTFRKYNTSLTLLSSFCDKRAIRLLAQVEVDALEDFRGSRKIGSVTWKVERQTLVTFFGYCVKRKWIPTNPARDLEAPRNLKPNEIVPYTLREEGQILAACDRIGGGIYNRSGAKYEQLRARAMVMLLRYTALRISDVATIRKDAFSWDDGRGTWRVLLRTQKTGDAVYPPIPEDLKLLLDAVPLPRNAAQDCPCYFWSGLTSRRGATFEQVADILENSPAVVRKHYGKWAKGRQDNIDRLIFSHFETGPATFQVTKKSHEKTGSVN